MSLLSSPTLRPLLFATLIACTLPAFAQQAHRTADDAGSSSRPPAWTSSARTNWRNLNAWLNRTIEHRNRQGRAEAQEEGRGRQPRLLRLRLDASPSSARSPANSAASRRAAATRCDNGQVWKQTDEATLAGVRGNDLRSRSTRAWSAMSGTWRSRATTPARRWSASSEASARALAHALCHDAASSRRRGSRALNRRAFTVIQRSYPRSVTSHPIDRSPACVSSSRRHPVAWPRSPSSPMPNAPMSRSNSA